MQAYSDPDREQDPHALPDVEVFMVDAATPSEECPGCVSDGDEYGPADCQDTHEEKHIGYYYWFCFPGCLPDSEAIGPFETEEEALEDARSQYYD